MPRLIMERVPDRYVHYGKMFVVIDGDMVGVMKSGEIKEFILPPGKHKVRLKKMWLSSKPIEFEVDDLTDKRCTCGPTVNGMAALIPVISIFAFTILCRSSLFVEMEQPGKVEFEMEFK